MKPKIAVIIVHGLGKQKKSYADKFKKQLREAFAKASGQSPDLLEIEAVHWADVFARRETELEQNIIAPYRLRYRHLRRYVIHNLADAVAYQPVDSESQNYDAVHMTISQALHRLTAAAGPTAPLCVIAHSLGAVIASNFFYDLQHSSRGHKLVIDPSSPLERGDTLSLFYSLGTTLPLWSLRYGEFDRPIRVPSDRLRDYHSRLDGGEWVNFYDKDDILGYPLKGVDPAYRDAVREDVAVNVGVWWKSWNPLCHSGYFASPIIHEYIAGKLTSVMRSMAPYPSD